MLMLVSQEHLWERRRGLGRTLREAELFPQKNSETVEKRCCNLNKTFLNTHLDLPILSERIAEEELTSVVPGSVVRATNFPAEQKTFCS